MRLYVIFEFLLCCVNIPPSGTDSLMYEMSSVHLCIKPRQTCQHLEKPLKAFDVDSMTRTIGLCSLTALFRLFLKHCNLTNKAVGDYMTGLVQTSSEATKPWSLSLWLLVGTPSAIGPELFLMDVVQPTPADVTCYFW